jgi:hypothetical protein
MGKHLQGVLPVCVCVCVCVCACVFDQCVCVLASVYFDQCVCCVPSFARASSFHLSERQHTPRALAFPILTQHTDSVTPSIMRSLTIISARIGLILLLFCIFAVAVRAIEPARVYWQGPGPRPANHPVQQLPSGITEAQMRDAVPPRDPVDVQNWFGTSLYGWE